MKGMKTLLSKGHLKCITGLQIAMVEKGVEAVRSFVDYALPNKLEP